MKIASVVCTYPPYRGGIGSAAKTFKEIMTEKGHEVATFVPDYGLEVDKGQDKKDNVRRLRPFLKLGNGAFLPQLIFHLKDFDAIYLHYPFFGGAEVVWLAKIFFPKKRLFIRYHMDVAGLVGLAKILSLPSRLIQRSLFQKAEKVISASIDYASSGTLKSIHDSMPEKFIEVPYAVDIDKFRPAKKEDVFKILFVGGLDRAHYFKGVSNLIKAVGSLDKETDLKWCLDIAGSGDLLKEYREEVKRHGLEGKIDFLGKVSDEELPGLYARSSVTVLPSINRGEAFGIVLVESMASGTPVLASKLPGVRGVFNDGSEGFLVEPGDINDLKTKLKIFLRDNELRERMGKKARKLALGKYSRDKICEQLNRVIEK